MLVLSRPPGTSIIFTSPAESYLITVLKILPTGRHISLLINHTSTTTPGQLHVRTLELPLNTTIPLGQNVTVTIVDIGKDKVRVGIDAPNFKNIHRLEVYEAIHPQTPPPDDDHPHPTDSRVPRPSSPTPPSLRQTPDSQ